MKKLPNEVRFDLELDGEFNYVGNRDVILSNTYVPGRNIGRFMRSFPNGFTDVYFYNRINGKDICFYSHITLKK